MRHDNQLASFFGGKRAESQALCRGEASDENPASVVARGSEAGARNEKKIIYGLCVVVAAIPDENQSPEFPIAKT